MQKWFDDGLDGIAEKQGIVAEVDFDVHAARYVAPGYRTVFLATFAA